MFLLRKFIKDFLFVQSRSWLSAVLGIFTSIVVARALGPDGRGILALCLLLPGMLSTFLNLGMASANVYYISTRKYTADTALQANTRIWMKLSFVGLCAGIALICFFGDKLFPAVKPFLLYTALVLMPLSLLSSLLVSILMGQQRFKDYNIAMISVPVVNFILIFSLVWWLNFGVKGVIAVELITCVVSLVIVGVILRSSWKSGKTETEIRQYTTEAIHYGIRSHLSNIMAFVNYRADMFLLNLFLSPATVGLYTIAVQIAEKLWMLSHGVSTVLLPKIGELNENESQRREITPFVARWILFVTMPAAVTGWFIIPILIPLFYGASFFESSSPFRILLVGITLGASSRVFANDLSARGRPELNFYAAIFVVSINILLNILLIPKYGLNGAATATTLAYSINFFVKIFMYKKVSGIDFSGLVLPNSLDKRAFCFIGQLINLKTI